MFAFLRKNQILLSSCLCLILSLYILTAAARGQLKNDPIGPILLWIMRPLQLAAQATTNWIQDIQYNYSTLAGYRSENEKLRKRIQELEVEKNQLLEAEATNRRLQQILEFRSQLSTGSMTASIIADSASS
jgi:cell shape-determining protein MreC